MLCLFLNFFFAITVSPDIRDYMKSPLQRLLIQPRSDDVIILSDSSDDVSDEMLMNVSLDFELPDIATPPSSMPSRSPTAPATPPAMINLLDTPPSRSPADSFVQCPNCMVSLSVSMINQHLDECLLVL